MEQEYIAFIFFYCLFYQLFVIVYLVDLCILYNRCKIRLFESDNILKVGWKVPIKSMLLFYKCECFYFKSLPYSGSFLLFGILL